MVIYRLFGTLSDTFKFEVYEWVVEKENPKTFEINSGEPVHAVKKRLSKDKIGVIKTNMVNTLDSLISYNVWLTDLSEVEKYKEEIKNKIVARVKFFAGKLDEKVKALQESGIEYRQITKK